MWSAEENEIFSWVENVSVMILIIMRSNECLQRIQNKKNVGWNRIYLTLLMTFPPSECPTKIMGRDLSYMRSFIISCTFYEIPTGKEHENTSGVTLWFDRSKRRASAKVNVLPVVAFFNGRTNVSALYPKVKTRAFSKPWTFGKRSLSQRQLEDLFVQVEKESPPRPCTATILLRKGGHVRRWYCVKGREGNLTRHQLPETQVHEEREGQDCQAWYEVLTIKDYQTCITGVKKREHQLGLEKLHSRSLPFQTETMTSTKTYFRKLWRTNILDENIRQRSKIMRGITT